MSGQRAKFIAGKVGVVIAQERPVRHRLLLLAGVLLVSGCVSTPTDALNLSDVLPPPPSDTVSDPNVRKSGQFPNINKIPQGQTHQMTEAEKARLKENLAPGQNRTTAADSQAAEEQYRREVAELRRLAREQKRRIDEQNF